jgi:DNA-binding NtrC family response regulator
MCLIPPKILAVDNDGQFLEMMKHVLESKGFEVVTAANLDEALKRKVTQSFDALVTELQIPRSEDGLAIVTAMRRSQPKAVIIVISASPDLNGVTATIPHKADEFLVKPFDFEHVAELIRKSSAKN